MPYNHIDFLETTAAKLKDIAHTQEKQRFFVSTGVSNLEGLIQRISSAYLPLIVAEDNSDERFIDLLDDNILALPIYTFYVLYAASPGNDTQIMLARRNGKITAKKVISRMLKLRHHEDLGLDLVDYNSFRFLGVGPLGDAAHGVMVTFSLKQQAGIFYNPEDWLDD